MPLRANRQVRESPQSLIRRFSQKIKKSGILLEARKKQFKEREKSSQLKKKSALRREKKRREYEKLKKMGKI
ncbi:30S ribosomal protein S21 [Patescibacteria group bacterium]|nr:30S ribosomal protein S21 [Patescibacteria group bacterium]